MGGGRSTGWKRGEGKSRDRGRTSWTRGGGRLKGTKGRTKRGRGWIRRSDRREDSITRHQQPGAYLVAIGFSLPKASPGFIPNCTFGDPCKTHRDPRGRAPATEIAGWRIIDHPRACISRRACRP